MTDRTIADYIHLYVTKIEGWIYVRHTDDNIYYKANDDSKDWMTLEDAFKVIIEHKILESYGIEDQV